MTTTNKTLLIFDWYGEQDLGMYLLTDAPDWLPRCHLQAINGCDDDEVADLLNRVTDALCEKPEYYGNPDDELAGAWVASKINIQEASTVGLGTCQIVVCACIP